MTLERVCWRNSRRTAWTVREVRGGQDVIFYDAMGKARENWHSCASARGAGELIAGQFGEDEYKGDTGVGERDVCGESDGTSMHVSAK